MLLITDSEGNALAVWSGDGHSLATIYPDNPEAQKQYLEYEFQDDPEVLQDPTSYYVCEGENYEYFYNLKPVVIDEIAELRKKRDYLLTQCDWTQLPDSPLTEEKKTEWMVYRQQLRDLPATIDSANPVWPLPPQ